MTSKKNGNYEIGYGKPPKYTRFKPKQSGNPKGRPKRSRNIKTDLKKALEEKTEYSENGVVKKSDRQYLFVMKLLHKAISGDLKAADTVLRLLGAYESELPQPDVPLNDAEQSVLDDFMRQATELMSRTDGGDDDPE